MTFSCPMPFRSDLDSSPVIPANLLYAVWNYVDYLVGYTQQDAHEFLIAFLGSLDAQLRSSKQMGNISELYTGVVQSNLLCDCCGNISTKDECFVDLSLSLDQSGAMVTRESTASFERIM